MASKSDIKSSLLLMRDLSRLVDEYDGDEGMNYPSVNTFETSLLGMRYGRFGNEIENWNDIGGCSYSNELSMEPSTRTSEGVEISLNSDNETLVQRTKPSKIHPKRCATKLLPPFHQKVPSRGSSGFRVPSQQTALFNTQTIGMNGVHDTSPRRDNNAVTSSTLQGEDDQEVDRSCNPKDSNLRSVRLSRRPASSLPSIRSPSKKKKKRKQTRAPAAATSAKSHKEKDYTAAVEQPSNNTKQEEDKCLTCIRYSRTCKGTNLEPTTVRGKVVYRCHTCVKQTGSGHNGRVCYWKDEANGVYTYEDAQKFHNGMINMLNRRAGRIQRAARRVAQASKPVSESDASADFIDDTGDDHAANHAKPPNGQLERDRILSHHSANPQRDEPRVSSLPKIPSNVASADYRSRKQYSQGADESENEEDIAELVRIAYKDLEETAVRRLRRGFTTLPSEAIVFIEMLNVLDARRDGMRKDILAGLETLLANYRLGINGDLGMGEGVLSSGFTSNRGAVRALTDTAAVYQPHTQESYAIGPALNTWDTYFTRNLL